VAKRRKRLLAICHYFPPSTLPTALHCGALLRRLTAEWEIEVVTETPSADIHEPWKRTVVTRVPGSSLLSILRRLRLSKLLELMIWPDEQVLWALAAISATLRSLRREPADVVVAFAMPYSTALAALIVHKLTATKIVVNFDDSPTCSDLQPFYASKIHLWAAAFLEASCVNSAKATVYVSKLTQERVRQLQSRRNQERIRLVRYGAESRLKVRRLNAAPRFHIIYTGAFTGWHEWLALSKRQGALKSVYHEVQAVGRHHVVTLDHRGSSPVFIGLALAQIAQLRPELRGSLRLVVHGNTYPRAIVEEVLSIHNLTAFVEVCGPFAPNELPEILSSADALLIALPDRVGGSEGGRISAKTYEYLATDLPILAAVPAGESRAYLSGKPGVFFTAPCDVTGMVRELLPLVDQALAGEAARYDREVLWSEISNDSCAREFNNILQEAASQ
jgi:hypothetical protein